MDLLAILKTSPLFRGVDEDSIRAMLHCLDVRTEEFPRGGMILTGGESVKQIGLLLSGSAELVQEDYWGNRNLMGRVVAGELFAEAYAGRAEAVLNLNVVATERCTVMWLDAGKVIHTCPNTCEHHNKIITNLMSDMAQKNMSLADKVTHMAKRTTRQKLLSYLSAQAVRAGSGSFDIPFNRQQLADYLAVDRSAMSAQLGRLREEGVLRFSRNHFELMENAEEGKRGDL